jgi:hypothetical protein
MEAFEEEGRKKRIGLVLSPRDVVWTILFACGLFVGLVGYFVQVQPYIATQERWQQKVDDAIQEIQADQLQRDSQMNKQQDKIDEILRTLKE